VQFEGPAGDDANGGTRRPHDMSFRGDPWAPDRPLHRDSPGEIRARALTAIERCERMPDGARQAATLAVEQDDDKLSRLAQYTVVASSPAYFRAFSQWFNDPIAGPHGWSPAERDAFRAVTEFSRAMSLGTTTAGGFLTPYELDPQILISGSGSVNPMRAVSRVAQTVFNEKRFVTSAGVTASWDAEAAEVSDDSPTLAQPPIVCYKGAAYVQSSYELDEDADLAQQVGTLFADAKAQLEAAAFTTGPGSTAPKGIITALVAAAGASVITSALTLLSLVDIIANQNALPPRWRANRWMANLSMINAARQIPLYANGPSIVNDSTTPPRCLGWDLVENSSMDGTIAAGSTSDYVWLSGDFKQYAIVDRLGTQVVPVPVVIGANRRPTGERGWYLHWRTGADVLIPTAFELTNYSG
jgi:HK97 family phage major capsid protein